MTEQLIPVWNLRACKPRKEVLEGKLTDAELALSLSAIVSGRARPPYDKPDTFFQTTHFTRSMNEIISDALGRVSGSKPDVNPVTVLEVGFGGGKTHTMAALYYAASHQDVAEKFIDKVPKPGKIRIVAISGEEYGDNGVERRGTEIRTIWGDFFFQLGVYDRFKSLDREMKLPSLENIRQSLEGVPVLILLDEFPTYLKMVSSNPVLIEKMPQFIQRLITSASENGNTVIVIGIAEDVYRHEAETAKKMINDAAKSAAEEARSHMRRKETVRVPIGEEDAVYILKKRLFETVDLRVADSVANAYHDMYLRFAVPDQLKSSIDIDIIKKNYPFHPELIRVLYERVSTLDNFQRTRGALRLLSRAIRRLWNEREEDALLIHPFHIDLADGGILDELTNHIGEERMKNACESDVWNSNGGAIAQELDRQSQSHWGAPLVRRACNTIYLYSLMAGRESERGLPVDLLSALSATPARADYYLHTRDTVVTLLLDRFQYIDKKGERFVFAREVTPMRVIEMQSRDVTDDEATKEIRNAVNSLFERGDPDWIEVSVFPKDTTVMEDRPMNRLWILNPNLYTITGREKVRESISDLILHTDALGKKPRKFTNTAFILVASADRVEMLRLAAKRLYAARLVHGDPGKYSIPKDRKQDVEAYLATQEKNVYDAVRSAFSNIVYYDREGVRLTNINPSGYSSGKGGKAVIAHYLTEDLRRIVDKEIDPDYIMSRVWPRDAESVSTMDMFNQFHSVPGLIVPATKELFQRSIMKGIKDGRWVVKIGSKFYGTDGALPSTVPLSPDVQLLLPDSVTVEDDKTNKPVVTPKKGPVAATRESEPSKFIPIKLGEAPLQNLLKDLQTKARREHCSRVSEVTIRTHPEPLYLLTIRNMFTRIGPDETVTGSLNADLKRESPPLFTFHFEISKRDAGEEVASSTFEQAWRMKGVEKCSAFIELKWKDGGRLEEAVRMLDTLVEKKEGKPAERTMTTASMDAIMIKD